VVEADVVVDVVGEIGKVAKVGKGGKVDVVEDEIHELVVTVVAILVDTLVETLVETLVVSVVAGEERRKAETRTFAGAAGAFCFCFAKFSWNVFNIASNVFELRNSSENASTISFLIVELFFSRFLLTDRLRLGVPLRLLRLRLLERMRSFCLEADREREYETDCLLLFLPFRSKDRLLSRFIMCAFLLNVMVRVSGGGERERFRDESLLGDEEGLRCREGLQRWDGLGETTRAEVRPRWSVGNTGWVKRFFV
jgi:hypothetical protein